MAAVTECTLADRMTTPGCEMDLKPGGVFRTVMRAQVAAEYAIKGVFLEVVEPERIVSLVTKA